MAPDYWTGWLDVTAPFISSADLAAYTRDDYLESALALIAIDAACEAVRGYVDQELETATSTNVWQDGDGSASLLLPVFPVTSVTAVSVYTDKTDTAPEVLVLDTDYVVDSGPGMVHRIDGGTFTRGRQNVKLTYAAGYATVPSDVRMVALQVAARIYEVGMVENDSAGGMSATYVKGAGSLTTDERHTLRRYRA